MRLHGRVLRRMKISTKYSAAIGVTAIVFFGGVGVFQLAHEEQDLRQAQEQEMLLLGRSLRVAAENAFRDLQPEDIAETVREVAQVEPGLGIYVFDADGKTLAKTKGAPTRMLPKHATSTELRFVEETRGEVLLHVVPLNLEHAPDASLMLVRSLSSMHADLASERHAISIAVMLFVGFVTLTAFLMLRSYVSRPLAAMVRAMNRVRDGDFSSTLKEPREDEIGEAQGAFNALVSELGRAREKLVDELDRRRQLERGIQQLEKLASVGQLAASIAHEIGSPLQALEGRAASLARHSAPETEAARTAGIIVEQSRRIGRIVSRLIEVAKRRPPQQSHVLLSQSVSPVLELLDLEARKRNVTLSLECDKELRAFVDPDQMQQIVFNLVRNAIQSVTSPNNAVCVRIGQGEISKHNGATSTAVMLSVDDDGCGISPEVRTRLFEPFFTTRAEQGGTGLGLAVVKSIVDDHRGTIEVTSELGKGTRVAVLLPQPNR